MRKVKQGDKVSIKFTGKTENDLVFITSEKKGPLVFVVGNYKKIKGLNQAVLGMGLGEKKQITISPDEGFGPYNQQLLFSCNLEEFKDDIKIGDVILDGNKKKWIIRDIIPGEGLVNLDGNHILAGKNLIFDIEIAAIG